MPARANVSTYYSCSEPGVKQRRGERVFRAARDGGGAARGDALADARGPAAKPDRNAGLSLEASAWGSCASCSRAPSSSVADLRPAAAP